MSSDEEIEKEIIAKGLAAPRVTLASINNSIMFEGSFTLDKVMTGVPEEVGLSRFTVAVLIMKNGFVVTGEAACVSAENFDRELGVKIARQNAIDKLWALEGYAMKDRMHRGL